jgi:hypothetical protein
MELPDDILKIIKEYSMPITRPDWRKGCYFNRYPFKINNKLYTFKYMLRLVYKIYSGEINNLLMNMMLVELIMIMNNI